MGRESFLGQMGHAGVMVNLVMFAFNLFPMLPLDGGRILAGVLPPALARPFARLEPFGFYIVMVLVMMRVIHTVWMQPLLAGTLKMITWALAPLRLLLF